MTNSQKKNYRLLHSVMLKNVKFKAYKLYNKMWFIHTHNLEFKPHGDPLVCRVVAPTWQLFHLCQEPQ